MQWYAQLRCAWGQPVYLGEFEFHRWAVWCSKAKRLVVSAFVFNSVSKSPLNEHSAIKISKHSAAAFEDECSQQSRSDEEFLMVRTKWNCAVWKDHQNPQFTAGTRSLPLKNRWSSFSHRRAGILGTEQQEWGKVEPRQDLKTVLREPRPHSEASLQISWSKLYVVVLKDPGSSPDCNPQAAWLWVSHPSVILLNLRVSLCPPVKAEWQNLHSPGLVCRITNKSPSC